MIGKLRRKFLLVNLSLISLVVVLILTVIYSVTYARIVSENRAKLRALPVSMTYLSYQDGVEPPPLEPKRLAPDYALSFVVIMSSAGEVESIESYIDIPDESCRDMALFAWEERKNDNVISGEGKLWQYSLSHLTESYSHILDGEQEASEIQQIRYAVSFLDVTDSLNGLNSLLITFGGVFILSLGLVYCISLFITNKAIKPISDAWSAQQRFIADASHELKTPLAVINANADALQFDMDEDNRWLNNIKQESMRMSKLADGLLNLIKTEDTSHKLQLETFDISELVVSILENIEPLAKEKELILKQQIDCGIIVNCNVETVGHLMSILLDNAIKYTEADGYIIVSLKKARNTVCLDITNTAMIDANALPHIFERFYRADTSRTGSGYGLGLAIAKALCDKISATLTVQSENGATTFTVCI